VIPCHNQAESLKETLDSLEAQTISHEQFEVILADDGSTDETKDSVAGFKSTYPLRYYFQEKSGASTARNRGAEEADAELLLFLDADMICNPELLSTHLRAHQDNSRVIVEGCRRPWQTAASPLYYQVIDVDTNFLPNMRREKNFGDMLSCNLSLEKSLFQEIGRFDAGLLRWEDIDFAYRAI
jgi:glycosyltransferase involved in cell wall biosynthesis